MLSSTSAIPANTTATSASSASPSTSPASSATAPSTAPIPVPGYKLHKSRHDDNATSLPSSNYLPRSDSGASIGTLTNNIQHVHLQTLSPTSSSASTTTPDKTPETYFDPSAPEPGQSTSSSRKRARPHKTPTSWDPHDDLVLRHLKEQLKLGWKEIASYFPNRTPNACQFRWRRLMSGNLRTAQPLAEWVVENANNPNTNPNSSPLPFASTTTLPAESEPLLSPEQGFNFSFGYPPPIRPQPFGAPPSYHRYSAPNISQLNPHYGVSTSVSSNASSSYLPSLSRDSTVPGFNSAYIQNYPTLFTSSVSPTTTSTPRATSAEASPPPAKSPKSPELPLVDPLMTAPITTTANTPTPKPSAKAATKHWTPEEDELLKSRKDLRFEELSVLMPQRAETEIVSRMSLLQSATRPHILEPTLFNHPKPHSSPYPPAPLHRSLSASATSSSALSFGSPGLNKLQLPPLNTPPPSDQSFHRREIYNLSNNATSNPHSGISSGLAFRHHSISGNPPIAKSLLSGSIGSLDSLPTTAATPASPRANILTMPMSNLTSTSAPTSMGQSSSLSLSTTFDHKKNSVSSISSSGSLDENSTPDPLLLGYGASPNYNNYSSTGSYGSYTPSSASGPATWSQRQPVPSLFMRYNSLMGQPLPSQSSQPQLYQSQSTLTNKELPVGSAREGKKPALVKLPPMTMGSVAYDDRNSAGQAQTAHGEFVGAGGSRIMN